MTKEKQRIVIAEFCGAKHVQFLGKKAWTFYPNPENLLCPMEHGGCLIDVPNYPNDLNAMHKAEKNLSLDQRDKYLNWLGIITEKNRMATRAWTNTNARADQRAEAFIKTIGLWEQS